MLEQVPTEYVPPWVQNAISLVIGAGAVKWLAVVLENRRLTRKDFKETMLARIRDLEAQQSRMQTRIGTLRAEVAHLETENGYLKERIDAYEQADRGKDVG